MFGALKRVVRQRAAEYPADAAEPQGEAGNVQAAAGRGLHASADFAPKFPEIALSGSARDYRELSGPDIFTRIQSYTDWQKARIHNGLWPYSRATFSAPAPTCDIVDEAGQLVSGVNFSSQDYMNLASHPAVKEAAIKAIYDHGVHSAGSSILLGNTKYSLDLEQTISDFLGYSHTTLFPTGWAAGYGVV
jgi:glycine C-acetyltransferase